MKAHRSLWPRAIAYGVWIFSTAGTASLYAGGLASFFARVPDVLTVTDVTDEGRSWPVPQPGRPVYYEAVSFGSKNFPSMPGDPSPDSRAMLLLIVKTLAKQGYLQARE